MLDLGITKKIGKILVGKNDNVIKL